MTGFPLTIVALDRVCFQGTARACSFTGDTGKRTFEAGHEPFVTVLAAGDIAVLEEGGSILSIAVKGGLARVSPGECVILVTLNRVLDAN